MLIECSNMVATGALSPDWARPEESRGPARTLPADDVCALFRRQVARTPLASAVRFGAETLTYAELAARVDRLAAALVAHGAGPSDLVALCAVRSLDLVVALLAILETGAAYVPIDPEAPLARVALILEQAAPRFVLAHRAVAERMPRSVEVLELEQLTALAAPATTAGSVAELAYVIFTSGSTGLPKGVEVRHVGLANHALAMAALYRLAPGQRVLYSASLGFDVAAEQIFPALVSGAEVVVRPEQLFQSFETFQATLTGSAISVLILPTAFFHEWVGELATGHLALPSALQVVSVGTEALSAQHLASFWALARGRVRLLQGYGPTETTITCTVYDHDGRSFAHGESVPIGLPLPNVEVLVLDAEGHSVPDGAVGELYVGGLGLARGYLGRPDLTRERFVPHPAADQPGARLYRTGDLARRGSDGQLHFLGRADFQIKVRGHRVEPAEIELVLREHAAISDAVVMLRTDPRGLDQLVAYVVPRAPVDLEALGRTCAARLPHYMVPSLFVPLASFPKTLNHKVDRAALPDPVFARAMGAQRARNDLELVVTRAFEEVLGVQGVSVDDHFFALGGDSLRALRMLQLLRRASRSELGVADVFGAPTVAALAARLGVSGQLDKPAVLCLKPGTGTPLFVVCGIQIYQPLADALRAPNPVYAVLLPREGRLIEAGGTLPSVERFASEYLRAIREHTPQGPYALGGLSFGGAVAYEMAQQLARAGERVSLLVLFDTVLPRSRRRSSPAVLRHQLERLRRRSLSASLAPVKPLLVKLGQRVMRRVRGDLVQPTRPTLDPALLALERQRAQLYGRSFERYDETILPYGGEMVLYRARESDEGALLPCYGFRSLVRRMVLHDVAGDHLSVLRQPGVDALAAHLTTQLTSRPPA